MKKPQNEPNVLVLMTAYNGEKWINQQVETILQQKNVNITLFISVDVSTDTTYEKCKILANQYANITVLEYGERFGGAAQNFFRLIRDVDLEAFDYIAFADHDDVWLDTKLSHAINIINSEKVAAFSSDVVAFWENGKQRLVKKSYSQKKYDYIFEAAGPGCTYVFRQEPFSLFKQFLLSNQQLSQKLALHDWAVYAFFRSKGMKWWIDDKPLMLYRQHADNQVGYNYGVKAIASRLSLIQKKWYRNQVLLIMQVIGLPATSDFVLKRSFLFKNFYQLRRRTRDAVFLLMMIILGVF